MHLLGHQGGWDEILMVVGPLVLIGGLLYVANRRVSKQLTAQGPESAESDGTSATATSNTVDGSCPSNSSPRDSGPSDTAGDNPQ